ncbi:MAG: hypothetical protein R2715_00810 [Ilumatobacteraceae bacterium]
MSWLPPAWGVDAALAAAEGRTVAALGWLVGSIGWARWYSAAGRRSPDDSRLAGRTVAKQHVRGAPSARPARPLPRRSPRELRYAVQSPSRRFNSSSAR